ncbi:MAG: 2-succinyl-5-enolpyruvyl-6-hydroxy-3-cyclohexene-1-carboxylate synthase [Prevotellaceae bacterium]|nr:2-succinyl-5-enolpyruvyl-6-hydroxy-3-cyclohexene-1-carboxylate synthase [Prevotellaceae bacterium]
MKEKCYTNERAQQIVLALLKAHGIKKVVASPGATNITLVASLQHDPYFEIYSAVDERSAAYIACGMAEESGEPVVLSCTGATASRNYMPGLTEAYYRKLPVLAVTATQGNFKIGSLIAQNIDRRNLPNDIALVSVYVPTIHNAQEEKAAELDVNRALLELKRRGGGPVHINLATGYSKDYSVKTLPEARVMGRVTPHDRFPELPKGRVAVFVGSHHEMSEELTAAIDRFCSARNAVVFCDHTSGYHGKYRVQVALIGAQRRYRSSVRDVDTLVHIGEVSGNYYGVLPSCVWRVSEDGELRDTFGRLRYVFEMAELEFFQHYGEDGKEEDSRLSACRAEYDKIYSRIPDLPFSNPWMAKETAPQLPSGSVLHLGILNSLRSWNFFELPQGVRSNCNVGGFGIDGNVSSLLGASLASPDKLFFGVVGDLAFFYDMNALGNRHLGKNLRILLVNNGLGTEFRNYEHPGSLFGEKANLYIAAAGHYGNKSPLLVRHYAEDLGFLYLSASTKEEYKAALPQFLSPEHERPIILEAFTNHEEESDAIRLMLTVISTAKGNLIATLKPTIKSILGDKAIAVLKKLTH